MNFKKVLIFAAIVLVLGITILSQGIVNPDKTETTDIDPITDPITDVITDPITTYVLEDQVFESDNIKIHYPQMQNYPGELSQDYMNQSLKKIVDQFSKNDLYSQATINYQVTKQDQNNVSILFTGTGQVNGIGQVNIQRSMNLDLASTNEINYQNYIKDDQTSQTELNNILNDKAQAKGLPGFEAEGVQIYFQDNNVIFYYMPLDDSAKEFVELSVPVKELDGIINTNFGEHPAS